MLVFEKNSNQCKIYQMDVKLLFQVEAYNKCKEINDGNPSLRALFFEELEETRSFSFAYDSMANFENNNG
jgi:hypothetical protein